MPKRKRDREIDKISKKPRMLERQLKRAKRRRPSSDSLSSEQNIEAAEEPIGGYYDGVYRVDDDDNDSPNLRPPTPTAAPLPAPVHPSPQLALPGADVDAAPPTRVLTPAPPPPPAPPSPPQVAPVATPPPTLSSGNSAPGALTDDDVTNILGDDPSLAAEYGQDIHHGLANRLDYIIANGLENDARKELCKKYLIPANCVRINLPILNQEIKAALPETSVKRDKGIENRQRQLGTVIACLSDIITTQLNEKDQNPTILKQRMDAVKLLCDTLHSDSVKRRYFASSSLKKDVNDHLLQTKIDKYLLGENLNESLKTAKAVTKSGAEIRVTYDRNKKSSQPQPSTSCGLNWKAPPPTRRQSAQQRSRQPYPPAGPRVPPTVPPSRAPPPHTASWRTSRYQPLPPRRRQ